MGRASARSASQYNKLSREVTRLRGKVDSLTAANRRLGRSASSAERRVKRLAKTVWAFRTLGGGVTSLGISGLGTGYPLISGIKEYANYEDSLISIRKVWTGAQEDYDKLVTKLKELHSQIPLSRQAIAGLAEEGIRAKVSATDDPDEYIEFTKLAAQFMVAFNLSAEEAPQILAKLKSQLGLTAAEFREFGDTLNTVANSFSTNEKEMLEGMRRIGGLALSIGGMQGVKDATAILGAQMSAGTPKEVAATGLRTLLARLSTQPKTTKNALRSLGLDPETVKEQLPVDLFGTVYDILEKMSKLKPAKRAGVLAELAGMKSFDAFSRLLSRADLLEQVKDVVEGDFRLTMQSEFERRIQGLNSLFRTTGNVLQDLSDSIVKQWRPQIAGFLAWLKEWGESAEGSTVLGWAAGFVALFSALSMVIVPLGIFAISIKALLPLMALLFSPISLIVGGLSLLAWYLAKKYDIGLDDVIAAAEKLGEVLQNPLKSLKELASYSFNGIRDKVRSLVPESWLRPIEGSSVNPKSDLPETYRKKGFWDYINDLRQHTSNFEKSSVTKPESIAGAQADKEIAVKSSVESKVTVTAPPSIKLIGEGGQVRGSITLGAKADKGRTQVDSAIGP